MRELNLDVPVSVAEASGLNWNYTDAMVLAMDLSSRGEVDIDHASPFTGEGAFFVRRSGNDSQLSARWSSSLGRGVFDLRRLVARRD